VCYRDLAYTSSPRIYLPILQPHSGHYVVPPTVWASAHTTQFVDIGWKMLVGASGNLAGGGSYVTMVSPQGTDVTIVVETATAQCHHCNYDPKRTAATAPQTLQVTLPATLIATLLGARDGGPLIGSGLPTLHVWRTLSSDNSWFIKQPDINNTVWSSAATTSATSAASSSAASPSPSFSFSITIAPESIYTISTTSGQSKGATPSPPAASVPFPSDWVDNFDGNGTEYPYAVRAEGMARYWADQCGSFQLMPAGAGRPKLALMQRQPMESGVNRWATNLPFPLTILGDPVDAGDRTLSVDVRLPGTPREAGAGAGAGAGAAGAGAVAAATAVEPAEYATAASSSFEYKPGRIINGPRDWELLMRSSTLAAAEAKCAATPQCEAITFSYSGTSPPPVSAKVDTWLTSRVKIDQPTAKTWQSYLLTPPHPTPPPTPKPPPPLSGDWLGLCGRVSSAGGGHFRGVCIELNSTRWAVRENTTRVAEGPLPTGFDAAAWHTIKLVIKGSMVVSSLDGMTLGAGGVAVLAKSGMVGLATGWNLGLFDNFKSMGGAQ
jgi:hypothetical protein